MITEETLNFGDVRGLRVGRSLFGHPLMTVIYYYFDEILIDTGPYCARGSIENFIEKHRVDRVLLTHYHEDHAGNAGLLVKRGIPVLGSSQTGSALARRNRLKPYEHIMFGKLEMAKIDPLPEMIRTKHYVLMPIHTPGHSCDHTVYHEPNQGWLFSGDLFLSPKIKIWRRDEDMLETIESLDRVLKLDFDSLFCGHNPQLCNPKKFIKMKRRQLLALVEKVDELLQRGFCRKEIVGLLSEGREKYFEKYLTLGDASYKNMIVAAMDAAMRRKRSIDWG